MTTTPNKPESIKFLDDIFTSMDGVINIKFQGRLGTRSIAERPSLQEFADLLNKQIIDTYGLNYFAEFTELRSIDHPKGGKYMDLTQPGTFIENPSIVVRLLDESEMSENLRELINIRLQNQEKPAEEIKTKFDSYFSEFKEYIDRELEKAVDPASNIEEMKARYSSNKTGVIRLLPDNRRFYTEIKRFISNSLSSIPTEIINEVINSEYYKNTYGKLAEYLKQIFPESNYRNEISNVETLLSLLVLYIQLNDNTIGEYPPYLFARKERSLAIREKIKLGYPYQLVVISTKFVANHRKNITGSEEYDIEQIYLVCDGIVKNIVRTRVSTETDDYEQRIQDAIDLEYYNPTNPLKGGSVGSNS